MWKILSLLSVLYSPSAFALTPSLTAILFGGGGNQLPAASQSFLTTQSLPSWLTFARTSHAMEFDASGYMIYAPNNLLLNTATLATQTVTTGLLAGTNYVLSFQGTGSVAISGGYTGNLAGTGVSNRVSLAFASTTASLTFTVTGSVTSAQLERVTYQTTPSAYVATTGSQYYGARFDYTPTVLTARGLLIEPSRTNLYTYSSDFTNANWGAKTGLSITGDSIVAPDNTQTGDTFTITSAGSRFVVQTKTVTASTSQAISVYAKKGNVDWVAIQLVDGANTRSFTFNLATGALGSQLSGGAGLTPYGSAIADAGNGWYKCTLYAATVGTSISARVLPAAGATNVSPGVGSYIYAWGAQFESGQTSSTSLIQTGSASVTRDSDVATLAGTAATAATANAGSAIIETGAWENIAADTVDLLSSSTSRRLLYTNASLTKLSSTNGTTVLTTVLGGAANYRVNTVRSGIAWQKSGRTIVAQSGLVQQDTIDLGTGSSVWLGGNSASATTFSGWVRSMAVYSGALGARALASKTVVGAPY